MGDDGVYPCDTTTETSPSRCSHPAAGTGHGNLRGMADGFRFSRPRLVAADTARHCSHDGLSPRTGSRTGSGGGSPRWLHLLRNHDLVAHGVPGLDSLDCTHPGTGVFLCIGHGADSAGVALRLAPMDKCRGPNWPGASARRWGVDAAGSRCGSVSLWWIRLGSDFPKSIRKPPSAPRGVGGHQRHELPAGLGSRTGRCAHCGG